MMTERTFEEKERAFLKERFQERMEESHNLLEYLKVLTNLHESGCKCNNEINQVNQKLKELFELGNGEFIDNFEIYEGGFVQIERQDHSMAGTYNDRYDGPVQVFIKKVDA